MTPRALYLLIGGLALFVIMRIVTGGAETPDVVEPDESVQSVEKRLDSMRKIGATVPGKEAYHKQVTAELAEREKGLIKAETLEAARQNLLETVQKIARDNGIDVRGHQGFSEKALSADYGQVAVNLGFACGMEQIVNLLTAIGNQPEILGTEQLSITGGNDKKKNVQVRLTVAAAVPRKLIPERKGVAAF